MSNAKNVLVAGGNAVRNLVAVSLAKSRFEIETQDSASTKFESLERQRPDFAIVELNETEFDEKFVRQLSLSLTDPEKRRSPLPVIALGKGLVPTSDGSLVESLPCDTHPHAIASHADALSRLATLEEELENRRRTANKITISIPDYIRPTNDLADAPILIAAGKQDATAVQKFMPVLNNLTVVEGVFDAANIITSGNYDALILAVPPGSSGHDELWVAAECRDNVRLFNLPIIMICEKDSFQDPAEVYSSGVNEIIDRQELENRLNMRATQLLRRQVYRRGLLKACQSYLQEQSRDDLTGLYSEKFMNTNLENEIEFARDNHKALAVAQFSFTLEVGTIGNPTNEKNCNSRSLYTRRIDYLLGRLIRGEDLLARLGGDRFALIMPGTSLAAAEKVVRRICAVVNTRELEVVPEDGCIPQYISAETTQVEADDKSERLWARLA